jgi:hypothetical protein
MTAEPYLIWSIEKIRFENFVSLFYWATLKKRDGNAPEPLVPQL